MKNVYKLLGIIALAAVIGISMTACGGDDDLVPAELRGTWKGTGSLSAVTVTITGTTFKVEHTTAGSFTADVSKVENVTNTGATSALYPSGYKVSYEITEVKGDGFNYEYEVGEKEQMNCYLSADKKTFINEMPGGYFQKK